MRLLPIYSLQAGEDTEVPIDVTRDKTRIAGVGDLIWFKDPAGNALGVMHYDPQAE